MKYGLVLFLVGILRLQDGCDYSALISKEEQIIIPENAGDTEAEIEKEKANKDDNSDDVEQGNNEFIRCFHQYISLILSTNFSQFEKRNKFLIGPNLMKIVHFFSYLE